MVVFQMEGKKAPGRDGFTCRFYQKNKDIVGEDVIDMTLTFFRTWNIAKVFNHTNISLIHKVPLAELFLRTRVLLFQKGAFLLANEVIYAINHHKCKDGIDAIKLDMSKSYNKLEWTFLENVLQKMGLSEHWTEAKAIWAVLKKVVEKKLTHIIIKSDDKDLIDQFSSGRFDGDPKTDVIYKDIHFFSSFYVGCMFTFQRMTCKSVAHELALWA
ncbi:uncharacterized protein LOC113352363 [Papaver somniferum]|uniref:uncharacterized protein LOC113352363 n=1 Tax=Papaver somniferum TaxID=3469 RepID=UPI000E6FA7A9|nr:uncharacterized protein LOC113352363 [Papaver somniferum]